MTDQNSDDADEVGYGKPPREYQFRKGKSGNPRGRPPKIEPSRSELQQALDFLAVSEQPVTILRDGKRRKFSGSRALFMKILQQALNGDKHAQSLYVKLLEKYGAEYSQAAPRVKRMIEDLHGAQVMQEKPSSPEDIKFINDFYRRTRSPS